MAPPIRYILSHISYFRYIIFYVISANDIKDDVQKVCVYWNINQNMWDRSGCNLIEEKSNNEEVVCSCSHLTNFAFIMGDLSSEDGSKFALDYISKLLAFISCVLLFVTQFCKHFIR